MDLKWHKTCKNSSKILSYALSSRYPSTSFSGTAPWLVHLVTFTFTFELSAWEITSSWTLQAGYMCCHCYQTDSVK